MRVSTFFLPTVKEAPAEAELVSHKLMLRAGLIRKLGSGLYTWLPLGLRVLRRVEAIVREEMDRSGAVEVYMPAVQPAELWQESGRWDKFGPQMLKIKDRHQRDFCFGPTHEEVITDIARREIRSYRQLPVNFYQIQTKFRDEIRPRFGVMRAREFIMKDAYSFHVDYADLEREYRNMYDTYTRIFERLGLKFRAVAADTGAIGGTGSHEFHVLADSGEDAIAFSPESGLRGERGVGGGAAAIDAAPPTRPRHGEDRHAGPAHDRGSERVPEGTAGAHSQDLAGGDRRPAIPSAAAARRPHAQRDQGRQEIPAQRRLSFRLGGRGAAGAAGSAGLDRPGRRSPGIRNRGPRGSCDERLRVRRQRGRLPPGRGELRARPAGAAQYADIRNVVEGDPSPDGRGRLGICRGIEVGPHLPAPHQILRVA